MRLGVGLIKITGTKRFRFSEVVSAPLGEPLGEPLEGLRLEVIEKLGYSLCTVCQSLFHRGEPDKWDEYVIRQGGSRLDHLEKAARSGKGLVYWLDSQAERFKSEGAAETTDVYHRRYVCPDCVAALFPESPNRK